MAKTATKKAAKKAAPKKATKVAPKKAAEKKPLPSKIDNRLSAEQKKNRDKMLSSLKKSSDEDVKKAIEVYHDAPDWTKENMRVHYEINGGPYINAIFRGDLYDAKKVAPETDKKLL